jgi:hypothetical protein
MNASSGFGMSGVVTVPSAETEASNGPTPLTVAVLTMRPASRSASVSPYVPVHVIEARGARVTVGQDTSGMSGSVTTRPVRVTLPVLVTTNVYGTSPPASIAVGLPAVLAIATEGCCTSVVSSVSVAVASSSRLIGSPDGGFPQAAAVFRRWPASMSVCVSVYVTVQVVDAFGASVPSGHDTGPAVGSDTVM